MFSKTARQAIQWLVRFNEPIKEMAAKGGAI